MEMDFIIIIYIKEVINCEVMNIVRVRSTKSGTGGRNEDSRGKFLPHGDDLARQTETDIFTFGEPFTVKQQKVKFLSARPPRRGCIGLTKINMFPKLVYVYLPHTRRNPPCVVSLLFSLFL